MFMLNSLPDHIFLFLQCILRYVFLLCNLLGWFRNNLPVFSRTISAWQVNLPMSSIASAQHLRNLFTWVCTVTRESTSKLEFSITLYIFKHMLQKFITLFETSTVCPAPLCPGPPYKLHHCTSEMTHIASVK